MTHREAVRKCLASLAKLDDKTLTIVATDARYLIDGPGNGVRQWKQGVKEELARRKE